MNITDLKKAESRFLNLGFTKAQFERECSFAIQAINKSKQLNDCTLLSKLESVVNLANVGLTLNPISRECYLIARYDRFERNMKCHVEPSYMGLIKLLVDGGCITSIVSNVVHENDTIEISLADNVNPVVHKIDPMIQDRGKIVGVYTVATLENGTKQAEWMHIMDIEEIRERSESYKYYLKMQKEGKEVSCVWVSDFSEMARKTPIKRLYKYLPKKNERVDLAINLDDLDYKVTYKQEDYILALLKTSNFDDEQRNEFEMELTVMSANRANEVIEILKDNQQILAMTGTGNPSQTQIANEVKELIDIDNAKEDMKK